MISLKGEKLHFHAPIGALVYFLLLEESDVFHDALSSVVGSAPPPPPLPPPDLLTPAVHR